LAAVAAAAVAVAAVFAVLPSLGDGSGGRVETSSDEPGSAPDVPRGPARPGPTSSSPPTTAPADTTTAPADLPACAPDQVDLVPEGEGATAQMVVGIIAYARPGAQTCRVETTATLILVDPGTGRPLDVEGTPYTGRLSVDEVSVDHQGAGLTVIWSGCAPGVGFEETREVIVEWAVDAYGTYRGTTLTPRCAVPAAGSRVVPSEPTYPPD
jgi:hypothetical protein